MLQALATLALFWAGGFGTGDFSQWDSIHQAVDDDNVAVVSYANHKTAGRFTVEPGDLWGVSGERAEVVKSLPRTKHETWKWDVRFPRSFKPNEGGWNIWTQFHQTALNCSPTVAFTVVKNGPTERLSVALRSGRATASVCDLHTDSYDLGPLRRAHWFHVRFRVAWSDQRTGHAEVWMDGVKKVDAARRRTLYKNQWVYLKQGFYRAAGSSTSTARVYIDSTRVLR